VNSSFLCGFLRLLIMGGIRHFDVSSDFGSEGCGFESLQAHHLLQDTYADFGTIKKKCVCHLLATFKAKGQPNCDRHAAGFSL
jgi:hypothetical protein